MASQQVSPSENQNIFSEEQKALDRHPSQESLSNYSTSDYSSGYEEPILGSVQPRPNRRQCFEAGWDRRSSLANEVLTEEDASKISDIIGRDWKKLGRALEVSQATMDDIDEKTNHGYGDKAHLLLVKYIQQQGSDATKGRLAYALFQIRRRDVAEKLGFRPNRENESANEETFTLKQEGSFTTDNLTFYTCRDSDGQLYLVRRLKGSGYEESCQVLKREDAIADSILMALDSKGIVEAERVKQQKTELDKAQKKLVELIQKHQKVIDSLEKQEKQEDKIEVRQQLYENEHLVRNLQELGTNLNQLAGIVGHLRDPFLMKAHMSNFSIGLSTTLKDLWERIKMLKEMATSNTELLGVEDIAKADHLSTCCRNLSKQIKLRDNNFIKCLGDLSIENQQRPRNCHSAPERPSTSGVNSRQGLEFFPTVRRASTQPGSQRELDKLAEEVTPPADPEEEDGLDGAPESW